jgi:hypothetical protein
MSGERLCMRQAGPPTPSRVSPAGWEGCRARPEAFGPRTFGCAAHRYARTTRLKQLPRDWITEGSGSASRRHEVTPQGGEMPVADADLWFVRTSGAEAATPLLWHAHHAGQRRTPTDDDRPDPPRRCPRSLPT